MAVFMTTEIHVTSDLCIPPEQAVARLRGLDVSAWSERQRKDLRIPRDLLSMFEEDRSARAGDRRILCWLQNAGRWMLTGTVERTEKGCRVCGLLDSECVELDRVAILLSLIGLCLGFLAMDRFTSLAPFPVVSAVVEVVSLAVTAVVLSGIACAYSVRVDRRTFEAFLRVAFEGAIMELTVSGKSLSSGRT